MPLRSIADSKETNIWFTEFSHELQYSKSTVPVHRFGFLRIIENVHNWSTVQLRFNHCCRHSTVTRSTCSEASINCPPMTPKISLLLLHSIITDHCSSTSYYSWYCRITPSYYYVSPYDVIEYRRWLWRTMNKKGKNFLTTMFPFDEDTWVRKFPVAQ